MFYINFSQALVQVPILQSPAIIYNLMYSIHLIHCGLVMAPSHYLNQCWLIISKSCGIHLRALYEEDWKILISKTNSEITLWILHPRDQWVKDRIRQDLFASNWCCNWYEGSESWFKDRWPWLCQCCRYARAIMGARVEPLKTPDPFRMVWN